MLRVVRPELVEDFAEGHDLGLWMCLCRLLRRIGLSERDKNPSLSILGELGRSLSMIKERHPVVAERIIGSLNNARPAGPCIRSAVLAAFQLMGVEGFEVPLGGACRWSPPTFPRA